MSNTIKFVPTQDLTVRKTKNGNSLIIRVIDDVFNGKGVELTEQSGGLHNLMLTADSPKVISEEDFIINAGDELTIVVADIAAIEAGATVNGKTYTEARAAFKQFRVVGYTPLEQRMKTKMATHKLNMLDQQLNNAKAVTQATVDAIKSGKQQIAATSTELAMDDKW